jgi:mannose-6-phosphate isomerase-like protein (cupin superfamily)
MKGSSRKNFINDKMRYWFAGRKRSLSYLLILLIPVIIAATRLSSSAFIDWEKVSTVKSHTGWTRTLLKGTTRSLDMLEVQAFTLYPGKATHSYLVDKQNDELFIIKEGAADISINNEVKHLVEGDLAVAFQENRVVINNKGTNNLIYYSIRFKPKSVKPASKPAKKDKTIYAGLDTIKIIKTPDGVRRNISNKATSSLRNLDIHLAALKADFNGLEPETHREEEIVLMKSGIIFGSMGGKSYRLGKGSILFLTNEDQFKISNGGESDCEYYVIRWLAWTPDAKK